MADEKIVLPSDSVTRWIRKNYIERDDTGEPVRDRRGLIRNIDPNAYQLRPDEDLLSLTRLEEFGREHILALPAAAEAFRNSLDSKKIPGTSAFSVSLVSGFSKCCAQHKHKVRILKDPVDGNAGHVSVHRFPRDCSDLLSLINNECFVDVYTYSELKNWDSQAPSYNIS